MKRITLEDLKEELAELKIDYAEAISQIKSLIIDRDFMKRIIKKLTQKDNAECVLNESGGKDDN